MIEPIKQFINAPDPDIQALFASDKTFKPTELIYSIISQPSFGTKRQVESSCLEYECDNPEVLDFIQSLTSDSNVSKSGILSYRFLKSTNAGKIHSLIANRVSTQFPSITIRAKITGTLRA